MLFAGDWNCPHHFRERLDDRVIVDVLVHDESDRAVCCCNQKRCIGKRHVIAYQKSTALRREVVASDHMNAIHRAGRKEQDQSAKPFRKQIEHICGANGRNQRCRNNHATRIKMRVLGKDKINNGRNRDAERKRADWLRR